METKLLPCPFCGGEAVGYTTEANAIFKEFVFCKTCDACTGVYEYRTDAIKAWNTRHERTCRNLSTDTDVFVCSECLNETHGFMVDKFGCTVGFGKVVSKCPNCDAKVVE